MKERKNLDSKKEIIEKIYEKYKDDWRILWQPDFLYDIVLKYSCFKKPNDTCDHKHCQFCQARISEYPEDLHWGYCTLDKEYWKQYWICEECFDDFKDDFNWKLDKDTD